MIDLFALLGRSDIDEWRDHWSKVSLMVLNDLAASVLLKLSDDVESIKLWDALLRNRDFITKSVDPHLRLVSMPVVEKIIAEANDALLQMADYHAIWHARPTVVDTEDGWAATFVDITKSAAPIAAGAGVVAALPTMAVTTSTALFGLLTFTAISWPVVIGGGTIAAVALAIGGLRGSGTRDRALNRLRKSVQSHVIATLIEGKKGQPALLEQVIMLLQDTAIEAKRLR